MAIAQLLAAATRRSAVDAAVSFVTGDLHDAKAFEALCRAVERHLETLREASATPAAVVPFGGKKGQPLSALSVGELHYFERFVTDALRDPEKQKYRSANLHLRSALLAELHRHRSRTS